MAPKNQVNDTCMTKSAASARINVHEFPFHPVSPKSMAPRLRAPGFVSWPRWPEIFPEELPRVATF